MAAIVRPDASPGADFAASDPMAVPDPALSHAARQRRAQEAMPTVLSRLGAQPREELEGTNVVQAATLPDGTDVVAKTMLYENGAEVAALQAWAAEGVPTAPVLAHGTDPAPYVVTGRVAGSQPDLVARFDDVASTLRTMHQSDTPPQVVHPDANEHVLVDFALAEIDKGGYGDAELGRATRALVADQSGSALVHGDLKAKNLIEKPDGTIVVIDPHGTRGHPEQDLARLVLSADPDADTNLGVWEQRLAASYGEFNRGRFRQWCGGYLLMRGALASWQDREPAAPVVARARRLLVT